MHQELQGIYFIYRRNQQFSLAYKRVHLNLKWTQDFKKFCYKTIRQASYLRRNIRQGRHPLQQPGLSVRKHYIRKFRQPSLYIHLHSP